MNSNVLLFPKISKTKFVRSRRRVFSIGMRYVGPALCQELQEVFIKRCGDGLWNLQFYYQGRAWVIERSESEDLPDAIARLSLDQPVEIELLRVAGWRVPGEVVCFQRAHCLKSMETTRER